MRERRMRVLLDQQDREAACLERRTLARICSAASAPVHRRLVEQQQFRPRHQGAANRQHLLWPPESAPGRDLALLGQRREGRVDLIEVAVISASRRRPAPRRRLSATSSGANT